MVRQDERVTKQDRGPRSILRQPLRTPRERLSWLLEFANLASSMRSLSDRELQLLGNRMSGFCEGLITAGDADELSATRLAKLSAEIASGIRSLIRGESWLSRIREMNLYLDLSGSRPTKKYIAAHLDAVLIKAHELLAAEARRLRRCPRQDCEKIFIANKRQIFCSLACSQQERTERFLDRHSEQELRERRHARYVAMVKRAKGAAAARRIRRHHTRIPSSGEQT
jgi:hypothetical protein